MTPFFPCFASTITWEGFFFFQRKRHVLVWVTWVGFLGSNLWVEGGYFAPQRSTPMIWADSSQKHGPKLRPSWSKWSFQQNKKRRFRKFCFGLFPPNCIALATLLPRDHPSIAGSSSPSSTDETLQGWFSLLPAGKWTGSGVRNQYILALLSLSTTFVFESEDISLVPKKTFAILVSPNGFSPLRNNLKAMQKHLWGNNLAVVILWDYLGANFDHPHFAHIHGVLSLLSCADLFALVSQHEVSDHHAVLLVYTHDKTFLQANEQKHPPSTFCMLLYVVVQMLGLMSGEISPSNFVWWNKCTQLSIWQKWQHSMDVDKRMASSSQVTQVDVFFLLW